MRRMRIRIDKNGMTTVAVEGAEGTGCLEFTRRLEEALGAVEKRELKEEYHHEETLTEALSETIYEKGGL